MVEVKTTFLPLVSIQKDWDQVIGKPGEEFWVSCSRKGGGMEFSHHGKLQYSDAASSGEARSAFRIKNWKELFLTVECVSAKCCTSFVAPQRTIHLHNKKLLCMNVSASGGLGVCSSDEGKLWVWDTDNGNTRRVLDGHVGCVDSCKFFPSGVVVLSGGEDMRVKIWSAEDGSCPRTFTGHTRGITDTAIVDRGRNFISTSKDGTARLWDCGSASCVATLASIPCPINSCSLMSTTYLLSKTHTSSSSEHEYGTEGKLLALACDDGSFRSVDVRDRQMVLELKCGRVPLYSCALCGEHTVVLGCEDGRMVVVDLRNTRDPLRAVSYGSSAVLSLSCLPGRKCVAGCADGTTIVWNIDHCSSTAGEDGGVVRLTGPDIDHITSIAVSQQLVYTSCRDSCVRMYKTDHIC